jgi:outer membrane protein assembly factor BamB
MRAFVRIIIFALLANLRTASGNDWPQFLGPFRNGDSGSPLPARAWPKEGPAVIWHKSVGAGFSGPVVSDKSLLLFHRIGDEEILECWDAESGKLKWKTGDPTAYHDDFGFDEGPRATPSTYQSRVYTYGAEGLLRCSDLISGKKVWSVDCQKEFGARKGFFGIGCSPLVESSYLVLNVGGKNGAGIVAFERSTGKVSWKATDDEASYSSPISAELGGGKLILSLTRTELVALEPADGKVIYRFPFSPPIHSSVTAATPLIVGNDIFLSASYDLGAIMLRVENNSPKKIWSGSDILSNHYATCIYREGFLFGIHGRTDPGFSPEASLRCIDARTGKMFWEEKNFGAATLILAGKEMLIMRENGELIRAPAASNRFTPLSRAQVLPNHVRAMPALANGRFFARSKDQLFCLDLN